MLRAVRPHEVAEEVLPRAAEVQALGAAARGDGARRLAHGAVRGRLGIVGHAADVVALEEDVRHAAARVAEAVAEPAELERPEAELAQVHGPDARRAALGRGRRALRVVGRREARRERRGRRVLDVRLVEVRADAERRVVEARAEERHEGPVGVEADLGLGRRPVAVDRRRDRRRAVRGLEDDAPAEPRRARPPPGDLLLLPRAAAPAARRGREAAAAAAAARPAERAEQLLEARAGLERDGALEERDLDGGPRLREHLVEHVLDLRGNG